jgi:RND family efflux transporter MFP subunit
MKAPIFLFFVFYLLTSSCESTSRKKQPTTTQPPEIEVAHPLQRAITYSYQYPAYLQAEQTVNIVARVSGNLNKINYTPGMQVKQGQLLFVIDPQPYIDQLQAAEAQTKNMQAKLNYAQKQYEKMKEAMPSKAISEIDFIQAESDYHAAMANLQNAQSQLRTARINLNYCYIKAPFHGKISRNMVDLQNFVSGSTQPVTLATMYRDQNLYAYFNMAYHEFQNLPAITPDHSLTVFLHDANRPQYQWSGHLDYTAPNVDTETGTITVRAVTDNSSNELLSGMYIKVNIPYKKIEQALLIPESSIGTAQAGRYVYLVDQDHKVVQRMVQTGILTSDNMREIISGIHPDDLYIVNALMTVRPGMTIKPILTTIPLK